MNNLNIMSATELSSPLKLQANRIDPRGSLWYSLTMTHHWRLFPRRIGTQPEIPTGYIRIIFPEIKLVLRENEAGHADTLRSYLRSIHAGRGIVYLGTLKGRGEIVIRTYHHGGLVGKALGKRFLSPRRFFRELTLTEMAIAAGVTSLHPLGVAYRETRTGVTGFWISYRIPEAESLYNHIKGHAPSPGLIRAVAQSVARMHRRGFIHPDLTLQNILITPSPNGDYAVSIIDFDKTDWQPHPDPEKQLIQLKRLDRSLLKWIPPGSGWRRPRTRLRFAAYYVREFPNLRPLIKAYARQFGRHERRYRLGWILQAWLGQSPGIPKG